MKTSFKKWEKPVPLLIRAIEGDNDEFVAMFIIIDGYFYVQFGEKGKPHYLGIRCYEKPIKHKVK